MTNGRKLAVGAAIGLVLGLGAAACGGGKGRLETIESDLTATARGLRDLEERVGALESEVRELGSRLEKTSRTADVKLSGRCRVVTVKQATIIPPEQRCDTGEVCLTAVALGGRERLLPCNEPAGSAFQVLCCR